MLTEHAHAFRVDHRRSMSAMRKVLRFFLWGWALVFITLGFTLTPALVMYYLWRTRAA
jgi:hypothetical protein